MATLVLKLAKIKAQIAVGDLIQHLVIAILLVLGIHLLVIYKSAVIALSDQWWWVKLYLVLTGFFLFSRFFILFFYRDKHDDGHNLERQGQEYPSVSFIIAAKDEGPMIYRSIATCLGSHYPGRMECVAIDDGSSDQTQAEMLRAQATHGEQLVKVISFDRNRGKREAMAEGILASVGEILIFVDSDSFLVPDAARHLVWHFLHNPGLGAVAGNSGVANERRNWLTRMQSARYGTSFNIFKACESVFGLVTCCPGCFSAYRRAAVLPILTAWREQMLWGTRSTFGDDRSLTNFVLRRWEVAYCRRARAITVVPERYRQFFKQQLRWKKSWVREGWEAATFIWRKHPLAAAFFYINLLLPLLGPVVVLYALIGWIVWGVSPLFFVLGVLYLSLLYGLLYFWQSRNIYWWYIAPFTLLYMLVLVWQMPYAILKLKDTSWGTR